MLLCLLPVPYTSFHAVSASLYDVPPGLYKVLDNVLSTIYAVTDVFFPYVLSLNVQLLTNVLSILTNVLSILMNILSVLMNVLSVPSNVLCLPLNVSSRAPNALT